MKMAVKQLLLFPLIVLSFNSCTIFNDDALGNEKISKYPYRVGVINQEILIVPPAEKKPVIAVYPNSFTDQTGQRRSNSNFATFSTAVTQAPYVLLIKTLKSVARGHFFEVVERVGLDNLTKERQLIRSTRESFDDPQKLKPLMFAGLIFEGAIIGYETNTRSGGRGARLLGIGVSKQYRQDSVTLSLRTVSVLTGRVLDEVTVSKTILSVGTNQDAFRFIENKTELIEIENGDVENESVTIALQSAIEEAVLAIIERGITKKLWSYKG